MADVIQKKKYKDLPKSTTLKDNDMVMISDGETSKVINGSDLKREIIKDIQVDTSNLATKEELTTELNKKAEVGHNHDNSYASKVSEHSHANKSELDKIQVGDKSKWDSKANISDIPTKTSQLTNDSNFVNQTQLGTKADKVDTYTKTEVNALIDGVSAGDVDLTGYYTKIETDSKLTNKSDIGHNHTKADIINFPVLHDVATSGDYNDLTNKPTAYALPTASTTVLGGVKVGAGLTITNGVLSTNGGGVADSVEWANVQNKPTTFTPSTHNHTIAQVTGLQTALDDKSDLSHLHAYSSLTGKPTIPTSTSQLTNDSSFATTTQVNSSITTGIGNSVTSGDIKAALDLKVDKVTGKGLSQNDLTNTLKTNYDGAYTHSQQTHAPANAEQNVQSDWNVTDNTSDAYIKNKPVIPSKTSELTNDSTFTTESWVANKIAEAQLEGGDINLDGLATKDELKTKADTTYVNDELAKKLDSIGHVTTENNYTTDEKNKLSGIAANANNYVHPNDANTRHITDNQINAINSHETLLEQAMYFEEGVMGDVEVENNVLEKLDSIENTELPNIKASLETKVNYLKKDYEDIEVDATKDYIDIERYGVKYNVATNENTDKIQKAFDLASGNNIGLLIKDRLIVTKSLSIGGSLNLKAQTKPKNSVVAGNSCIVFSPTNSDTSLFIKKSNLSGKIENILFHTHTSSFWTYNKSLSCFKDMSLQASFINGCVFAGFNRVFDTCDFGAMSELNRNKTYNIYDSIFYNCAFSDVHIYSNYFNGGKPVDSNNKGFYPSLFKQTRNAGLVEFQKNWVEFVKDFLINKQQINVIGNIFDFVYNGEVGMDCNIVGNSFSHISNKQIVANFNSAGISSVVDELNSNISILKLCNYGANINNNLFCDLHEVLNDTKTILFEIYGDINGYIRNININNNNGYAFPTSMSMSNIGKIIYINPRTYTNSTENVLANLDIDMFKNVSFADLDTSEIVPGIYFTLKNKKLLSKFNYSLKKTLIFDSEGNNFGYVNKSSVPKLSTWAWLSSKWVANDEKDTISYTSSATGWQNIRVKISISSNKIIRINSNNTSNSVMVEVFDSTDVKFKTFYPNGVSFTDLGENASYIYVYLRVNVTQANIDNLDVFTFNKPTINLYSDNEFGKVIKGIDNDSLIYIENGVIKSERY